MEKEMAMEKNTILAVVLSTIVLVGFIEDLNLERKVSFSSSVSSSFHHSSYASSMKSSIAELEVQNYWEIPIYSYYTFSFVTEDELNEISSEIPNTQEPETIEILEINETGIHGKNSRQSSYSSINTAKNSPEVKILKMLDTQEHKLMKNGTITALKNIALGTVVTFVPTTKR